MEYGLGEEVIQKIQGVFAIHPEIEKVLIYGSRAMERYKPASDIDLTFIGERVDLPLLNKIEWELDDLLLPYTFDLSIYHKIINTDVVDHIIRVGKLFYERTSK